MSENEEASASPAEPLNAPATPASAEASGLENSAAEEPRPARPRRRRVLWCALALLLLLAVAGTSLCWWMNSSACEELVRRTLISSLEKATGGRVELAAFHWRPFALEAEANGLVVHGKEAPSEEPFFRANRLDLKLSLLNFFSPRLLLRSLSVEQPHLHLIAYADGSTNQPTPRRSRKSGKSALDSLFDFKAGRIAITSATLFYEDRASGFDYQNRTAPLSLLAEDLALQLGYVEAQPRQPESFHLEAGLRDLRITRGPAPKPGLEHGSLPVTGYLQASLDLTRNDLYLHSLRITARAPKIPDHTLEISGAIRDFRHPGYAFQTHGDLDLHLVEPLTGYPCTPEGVAHLDLNTSGHEGGFLVEGSTHITDGAYIGTSVYARHFLLDAHVRADSSRLLIDNIALHLQQGGLIRGAVDLGNYLKFIPVPKGVNPRTFIANPVDGKVDASFTGVPLNAIMAMFCDPPFQNLGLDTTLNGPASAVWQRGDVDSLAVSGNFHLAVPQRPTAGMVPTTGLLDATYYQKGGGVDLRGFELQMPASHLLAHGRIGAYPMRSPSTAINVDLTTSRLAEFDTVLRDLGLAHAGRSGVAALPVSLAGQAEFHGLWSGSLLDPRISGQAKASQLSLQLGALSATPPAPAPAPASTLQKVLKSVGLNQSKPQPQPAPAPRQIQFDTVEASGSYSASQIRIDHATLRQHQAILTADGTLNATSTPAGALAFDTNSVLHGHLRTAQTSLDQIRPFLDQDLPAAGLVDAQLSADGPLRQLSGSGWVELNKARIFDEPIDHIRAQGSFAGKSIRLTQLTLADLAGKIAASGSIDLGTKQFQLNATTSSLDIAHLDLLRRKGISATGKLGFTLAGAGSFDDPRLEGRAVLANLALGDEPLGTLIASARTQNHALLYELSTRLDAAELSAHGQTSLQGDHVTQARIDFSRFNIGALLKMANVPGLSGNSELAGNITLEGPLSKPEALHGEARLNDLALAISGVHLHSDGEVHATLAGGLLRLDPLHITGENTDMRLHGSLSILEKEKRQLDIVSSGSINLALARTLDPDLTASGVSTFAIEAHGPLEKPDLRGRIDFQNGALALEDLPNGLSQIHGMLEFNQNRLEVKSLTAQTGGGQISLGGYLAYQKGLYANLTASGKGIRIRYPQGVSSLADASLHLQGTQNSMLLSGDVLITRFAVSPDFDFATLAAQTSGVQAYAPPDAPSNHIRLDVHLTSSPQLNFQNAVAKLAGNVDLRLHGTVASPSLLGRVSITEGTAVLAGNRYELQRGELAFTNPVRIEPTIDLNATAHVEDFDISLGLHGPIDHPTISYRSDPPLPEADVVALLALGRTQSQQRLYTAQQQSQSATTDALLGGALNNAVSSRVQKLFGAGSVKVDPNYLGALGNSTSRIIVEEQLGRNVTLTYATNVNTTGQQLLQAEIAINRHVSLQLARDESGVFSVVLKATRRYR